MQVAAYEFELGIELLVRDFPKPLFEKENEMEGFLLSIIIAFLIVPLFISIVNSFKEAQSSKNKGDANSQEES